MKNLIKTIQNTIFQQELFKRGSGIVLGVSGGPDSVCLLDVLAKLAPKYDLKLIIAHVNYGLRGKESDKDEEFVRKLAEKYGIKFEVFPKARLSEILKPSFRKNPSENELRNIRYNFFEKVRKENKFDLIAVAHNADDQVETFLMRIIRGAGLQGLSAMKYKSEKIIRPLLGISRKEILGYLKNRGLGYRIDKTNEELMFFRNRVRNKLIPYLEKNFNPNIRQTIFKAAENIAEDYSLISDLAKQTEKKLTQLSVKRILKLHPALRNAVMRSLLGKINADLKDIESAHIGEIIKILKSTKSKSQVVVFKGLKTMRKGDKVAIEALKNNKQ